MRWLILALASVPALAIWATVVFVGTANGWWRSYLAPPGNTPAFAAAVAERLDAAHHGNAAFRLLQQGEVAGEHYVSAGEPVHADTRFPAAALSKWVTAWGVMTLVESGAVDLDAPVDDYLTRWHLPEGPFDNGEVTARRLLSHTAGLTDGLGYGGFPPGVAAQPLEESLSYATDALPGADGHVRVGIEPGSSWIYSGGGYALLQLMIEEVSGQRFEDYMQQTVLRPLGLHDSTFVLADTADHLATVYDVDGTPAPNYRFSAPAAAGLYTTAADLTRFLQAQLPGPEGQPAGRGVLQSKTLKQMREPHATAKGTHIWGLGHMLYAPNGKDGFIIGHDGGHRPAINTSVRLDPATGDGVIVLVTGAPELASVLGGEWIFWRTGRLDVVSYTSALGDLIVMVAVGWGVIALIVVAIGWRVTRQPAATGAAPPRS